MRQARSLSNRSPARRNVSHRERINGNGGGRLRNHHEPSSSSRPCERFGGGAAFAAVVLFGFGLELWVTFTQQLPALMAADFVPTPPAVPAQPAGASSLRTGTASTASGGGGGGGRARRRNSNSDNNNGDRQFYFDDDHKPRVVTFNDDEEEDATEDKGFFGLRWWPLDGGDTSSSGERRPRTTGRAVEPMTTAAANEMESQSHIGPAAHHYYDFERPYYETCVPMKEWQTWSFPTCNRLHEIEMVRSVVAAAPSPPSSSDEGGGIGGGGIGIRRREETNLELVSTKGSWRTVWRLLDLSRNESAALKLLRTDRREFDAESYEYNRVDALAMERLHSSEHVMNVHGYCGQSVLTEYATGTARTFVKDPNFKSLDRLRLGRDLARAFRDVHSIDYANSTNPTLAHNDINMANAVVVDGRIVLNDFNIAVLMKWNGSMSASSSASPDDNRGGGARPCGYPVRFEAMLWKSPEENANRSYVDPAMADVYGLGNLLFQVMTKHQPWTHLEPNGPLDKLEVARRKAEGILPHVPPKHAESKKTAIQVLYHATMACFRPDPELRPTSYQLSRKLDLMYDLVSKGYEIPSDEIRWLFEKRTAILHL